MIKPFPIRPAGVSALIEAAEEAGDYFSGVFNEIFSTNDDADEAAEMNAVLNKLAAAVEQAKDDDPLAPVATLPFVSQVASEYDPAVEGTYYDVAVWRSTTNICDQSESGQGRCDTGGGLYYGTSDMREGKFCPRHYYEMHFGQGRSYELVDQTVEEYESALAARRVEENG